VTLYELANAATGALTVDTYLNSITALISLGLQMKSVSSANLEFVTTPWQYAGARVELVEPDTGFLWSLLRQDRTLQGQDVSGAGGVATASAPTAGSAGVTASAPESQVSASAAVPAKTKPSMPGADATTTPATVPIPTGITDNIRRGDADPCSNLSYGH
jgi:hypothetical protein